MNDIPIIIAIDPGKSGGIAAYVKGRAMAVRMPGTVKEIELYLKYIISTYGTPVVFIEKVQAYSVGDDDPGKKFGINKMLANYAQLLTIIQLLDLSFCEVYPVSWQSTLGLSFRKPKLTKTQRKNRYKEYASNSFPEIPKMTLTIADALCVLQFALVKYGSDRYWIEKNIKNLPKNNLF